MSNEEKLINILSDLNYTITTAESCTGGMISSMLIDVSGASKVVNECHVTYSNDAKVKYLKVDQCTLDNYGAVSEEVAYEMAKGAKELARADVAISVTGLAGPGGGTDKKPVGLVYIGCNVKDIIEVKKYIFNGNRTEIRKQTTQAAIKDVLDMLNRISTKGE